MQWYHLLRGIYNTTTFIKESVVKFVMYTRPAMHLKPIVLKIKVFLIKLNKTKWKKSWTSLRHFYLRLHFSWIFRLTRKATSAQLTERRLVFSQCLKGHHHGIAIQMAKLHQHFRYVQMKEHPIVRQLPHALKFWFVVLNLKIWSGFKFDGVNNNWN